MIAVAIDGPTGAGKSTLARAAAKELGYVYVDTGACYRGIGYYALQQGFSPEEPEKLVAALPQIQLHLAYNTEGEQRIFLNGEDVSEEIRSPEVSEVASQYASLPQVREHLLALQREMAERQNVVMDGRDIGTVVLPDAQVKIFLTASDEERAQRRYKEYLAKGENIGYNKVLEDLRARDKRDRERSIAPLLPAEDAVILDSTKYNFEQTLARILEIITDRNDSHVL